MSRLTRLKHQSATATLTDNNFKYNPANQINQITELTQTKTFGYDTINRLTSMTNGTANENYAFDGVGNRTTSQRSSSYGYQPFNKLTSTQTATYTYNANGNMLSKSDATGYWVYGWDYENRMTTARKQNKIVRYQYDALGRRVLRMGKNVGATAKYTYDGLDVLMDDGSEGVVKYQNGLGIDNKLKMVANGNTKYFLQDHLGSTVGLADSSGNVVSSANYDSFGNSTNNLSTRYQYTGREKDEFTGLMYYRARWYDANLGRFISEDPVGFRGSDVNLFGYVFNNPNNLRDPKGTIALPFMWFFSKPPNEECDETCQRDLSNINNTFDNTVREMTESGQRNSIHWSLNGLQGTYTLLFGGEPYLSCVDQAKALKENLESQSYENNYKFYYEQSTIPGTDEHPHTRIVGISPNPKLPRITLDPWKGTKGRENIPLL